MCYTGLIVMFEEWSQSSTPWICSSKTFI